MTATSYPVLLKGLICKVLSLSPVLMVLAFSLLLTAILLYFQGPLSRLGEWGYVGAFITQMIGSATVLLPTPSQGYILAMAVTLNPLVLGLIGGIGAALGELTGYYLGARGRRALQGGRLYQRLEAMPRRWTGAALFSFALLPVPFDVAGLWAGAVRFPISRFLLYVAVGKAFNITVIALVAHYGISWLLKVSA